jgi:hypothetical protein
VDPLALFWIIFLVTLGSIFNYYLNRAPGADPDDFQIAVGPIESGITCDCFLNTLIVSTITAIIIALSADLFESTIELLYYGVGSFIVVWIAGILGRMRRHAEWKELDEVVRRVVPTPIFDDLDEERIDILFDDDDEY